MKRINGWWDRAVDKRKDGNMDLTSQEVRLPNMVAVLDMRHANSLVTVFL